MKLENQVCSLELAKKLKELNCKQDSLWWWDWSDYFKKYEIHTGYFTPDHWKRICSAFTVAELGGMLPNDKIIEYAWRTCEDESEDSSLIDLLKDPNKLAECLIYFIGNDLMEIPK